MAPEDTMAANKTSVNCGVAGGAPVLFRAGPLLVASSGVVLPQVCIRCGAAPASETIKKNFTWHHPALYLLVVAGVLIYAIVAVIVQKKTELRLPFCAQHAEQYRRKHHIAIALLVSALPVLFVLGTAAPDSFGWWVLLCMLMFVAGAVVLSRNNILWPKRIEQRHGYFFGAHETFLVNLQEAPSQYRI